MRIIGYMMQFIGSVLSSLRRIINIIRLGLVLLVMLVLAACTTSRYSMEYDVGPSGYFDASLVPDPVPIWEPLSPGGNKTPYIVRGKKYHLLNRTQAYSEEGVASWYGLKFHGELTSNGEIYNMYEMTAAHKTLPLPSYVRVTNLDNDKSIVVRVNDRGPFHSGRIIDLSYAAAKKLAYDNKGTANVKLDLISPVQKNANAKRKGEDRLAIFVQLGAFANKLAAEIIKDQANKLSEAYRAFVVQAPGRLPALYRVRIGPIKDKLSAENMITKLQGASIGQPIMISRSVIAKGR